MRRHARWMWLPLAASTLLVLPSHSAVADACSLPAGVLTMALFPAGSSVVDCSAVGRDIENDGIMVTIPAVGDWVSADGMLADGATGETHFSVNVDDAGLVSYETDADLVNDPLPTTALIPACQDGGYTPPERWWHTVDMWRWRINYNNHFSDYSESQIGGWLQTDADHITTTYNDCGTADVVDAVNRFLGTTTDVRMHQVGGKTECDAYQSSDFSVVGFGDLNEPNRSADFVGLTCSYGHGTFVVQANTRFNTTDYNWTNDVSVCSGEYDIQSVATHEFGHAYGLAHILGPKHGNLTMNPSGAICSAGKRTLGLGDVLAMQQHY